MTTKKKMMMISRTRMSSRSRIRIQSRMLLFLTIICMVVDRVHSFPPFRGAGTAVAAAGGGVIEHVNDKNGILLISSLIPVSSSSSSSNTWSLNSVTASSSSSSENNNDRNENDVYAPLSMNSVVAVGGITAMTGFLYGKILAWTLKLVWQRLPGFLLKKNIVIKHPIYFMVSVCTLGGIIVGTLGSLDSNVDTFTVGDFVSAFSSSGKITSLPSSSVHLMPLLTMSLLTSTFGFSVGPEAPMVCAGALIGSSISRRWYGSSNKRNQEILSYAGASGALTASMGIPIAGSLFALEMTRPNAGLSLASGKALQPSIISSIAALALVRGLLIPSKTIGGHFEYGPVGALSGREMILTSISMGIGGAVLGTVFHKVVHTLKKLFWPKTSSSTSTRRWKYNNILVKAIVGLIVGLLGTYYPQTLFWGEGSLQTAIDGHKTAFASTRHGLSNVLTSAAKVNPSVPFESPIAAAQVGIIKLLSITLACAGKFPGGIIFPLFFAGAPFAHACSRFIGPNLMPVAVFCLMAATQASATRTPLATVFILSLLASSTTELSLIIPAGLISSYLGVFVSRQLSRYSYFSYNE